MSVPDDRAPDEETSGDEAFDPGARRLCSDGACTGVVGEDGRCKVCGRAGEPGDSVDDPAAAASGDLDDRAPAIASAGDDGDGGAFADDERRLCPDGACIGLLGEDGRCKVCGRAGDEPTAA